MPRKEVGMNITVHHGKVVIQFSEPIQELPLEPQDAAIMAKGIAEQAVAAAKQHGLILPKQGFII